MAKNPRTEIVSPTFVREWNSLDLHNRTHQKLEVKPVQVEVVTSDLMDPFVLVEVPVLDYSQWYTEKAEQDYYSDSYQPPSLVLVRQDRDKDVNTTEVTIYGVNRESTRCRFINHIDDNPRLGVDRPSGLFALLKRCRLDALRYWQWPNNDNLADLAVQQEAEDEQRLDLLRRIRQKRRIVLKKAGAR